jgi:acyl transferase domain-containing protein
VNGPQNIVISGKRESMKLAIAALEAQGVKTKNLKVSHAFHSPLMEPMLADFEQVAKEVAYSHPRLDIISNITGEIATEEIATPEYWCRHIRQSVRFATGMEELHQQGYELFLEIGSKPTLLGMGHNCLPEGLGVWLPSLRQGHSDWQHILQSLGELYIQGVSVNWSGFEKDYLRHFLDLPTYPFQRRRYWLQTSHNIHQTNGHLTNDSQAVKDLLQQTTELLPKLLKLLTNSQPQQTTSPYEVKLPLENQQYWLLQRLKEMPDNERLAFLITHIQSEVATVLRLDQSQLPEPKLGFFEMGMDSLLAVELKNRLERSLGVVISSTLAFNYPNITSLAGYLLSDVIGLDSMTKSDIKSHQDDKLALMAIKVEHLSDQETEALVLQKLTNILRKN